LPQSGLPFYQTVEVFGYSFAAEPLRPKANDEAITGTSMQPRTVLVLLMAMFFGLAPATAEPRFALPVNMAAPAPRPSNEVMRTAAMRTQSFAGGFLESLFGEPHRHTFTPTLEPAGVAAPYPSSFETDATVAPSSPAEPAMDPRFLPKLVDYTGTEKPGTVIINTTERLLYLVQGKGKALRYGIGVGRPGFGWSGVKQISMKREWPDWRPPDDMLKRRPDLPRYMPGGPENPLGARAMYLGSSLYRIHGSNEPWTIGTAVSSGCFRMRNEDVIDLFDRVRVGTKVVVI
jgi:lipoprotein-anchoring transpeptidase ErfK/SrfK